MAIPQKKPRLLSLLGKRKKKQATCCRQPQFMRCTTPSISRYKTYLQFKNKFEMYKIDNDNHDELSALKNVTGRLDARLKVSNFHPQAAQKC